MPNPFVRVDVWSLADTDPIITWYAKAVATMKAKPAADPTSWTYQAAIHGSLDPHPAAGWNQCRHGSWYFVSWHRMYLYFFERIVRAQVVALGGPADWALPYWNYDGGNGHNALPTPFRNPMQGGQNNPLYLAERATGINAGAGLPPSITSPAFALSRTQFTGASEFGGGITSPLGQFFAQTGRLEQTPHNDVHVAIGGFMGNPDTAAEDPIFWLHHANIDRIWWLWQQQPTSVPTTDPAWLGQSFPFFDDGGAPASLSDAGVLDTTAQLDYTYDHAPIRIPPSIRVPLLTRWPLPWPGLIVPNPPDPVPERTIVGASVEPVRLIGGAVTAPVVVDERAVAPLRAEALASTLQQRAFLDIDDIEAERNPGAVYGVYVNLPPQPTADDLASHHVGNLSTFGVERARNPRGDEHAHGLHVSMEITEVLDRMAADGSWHEGNQLAVTFLPQSLEAPAEAPGMAEELKPQGHADLPITIGRVSLHFA